MAAWQKPARANAGVAQPPTPRDGYRGSSGIRAGQASRTVTVGRRSRHGHGPDQGSSDTARGLAGHRAQASPPWTEGSNTAVPTRRDDGAKASPSWSEGTSTRGCQGILFGAKGFTSSWEGTPASVRRPSPRGGNAFPRAPKALAPWSEPLRCLG